MPQGDSQDAASGGGGASSPTRADLLASGMLDAGDGRFFQPDQLFKDMGGNDPGWTGNFPNRGPGGGYWYLPGTTTQGEQGEVLSTQPAGGSQAGEFQGQKGTFWNPNDFSYSTESPLNTGSKPTQNGLSQFLTQVALMYAGGALGGGGGAGAGAGAEGGAAAVEGGAAAGGGAAASGGEGAALGSGMSAGGAPAAEGMGGGSGLQMGGGAAAEGMGGGSGLTFPGVAGAGMDLTSLGGLSSGGFGSPASPTPAQSGGDLGSGLQLQPSSSPALSGAPVGGGGAELPGATGVPGEPPPTPDIEAAKARALSTVNPDPLPAAQAGGPTAPATATGTQPSSGVLDSLGLTKNGGIGPNALPLGLTGYSQYAANQRGKGLQSQLTQASQPAKGASEQLIAEGLSGQAPPAVMAQYEQSFKDKVNEINQRYANMGRDAKTDSGAQAEIKKAQDAKDAAITNYSQTLLQQGLSAANIAQGPVTQAAMAGANQDQDMAKAMAQMMQQLAFLQALQGRSNNNQNPSAAAP